METVSRRDDAARLVVITITGRVTAADIVAGLDAQAETGTWSYAVLYDERAAHVDLSAAEMRSIAGHASRLSRVHGPRGPVAIVASADVDYGVNRMASAYAEIAGYSIQAFRTIEEARVWLAQGRG